jgi:glycerol-3-phosphate acyltransferase PlsX
LDSINFKKTLIVDAMGGDFAPGEILKGATEGSALHNLKLIFTGDENLIRSSAAQNGIDISNAEIINSTDEIRMDDSPSEVLKKKKNSSVYLGTERAGKTANSAFLSAGNTGAVMACSLFNMKKIEGIFRPAIAVVVPLGDKKFVLIDAGANTEIKPVYLKQFAIMGSVYCREILKIKNPKTGLLNVGSEEKKGNEITVEAFKLLKDSGLNFTGNVEGRDIFEGAADVVVCDGFVGNILLKSIEGMAGFFFNEIKGVFLKNLLTKLSALTMKKHLKQMKLRFDYERYGGALLLGINGVTIISHGSSKSRAIANAARVASESLDNNIVDKIKEELIKLN